MIVIVLLPIVKPNYILHKVSTHPFLSEFKRCKLMSYNFTLEERNSFTVIDLYRQKYKAVDLYFRDTIISKYNIHYNYKISVLLNGWEVQHVLFEKCLELTDGFTLAKIINEMEEDSALVELVNISDVKECHYQWPDFIYAGAHDLIKYNKEFGVTYFKLQKVPAQLKFLSKYGIFLGMIKRKGLDYSDFDSIHFIRYAERL